jgi:hypothetical protein
MNKTFLIVFHGQLKNGKIIDIGDDPCFDNPPSWGICRPTTRRAVKIGDTLIFVAKLNNGYFLKGWFQVGDKIDYISALQRYPNRQNVIISETASLKPVKWRYKNLQKNYFKIHGQTPPKFLSNLKSVNGAFFQSQTDDHETDNWKCRRIFHCTANQFRKCITANSCLKSNASLTDEEYKNYVVADQFQWEDLDSFEISFDEVVKATNFPTPIKTPKGQHNVLRFDNYKHKLFTYIETKKSALKN